MLQKDQDVHKKDNSKIMSENVYLLQEINDQRKECHALKQKIKQNQEKIDELMRGGAGFGGSQLEEQIREQENIIQGLVQQINEFDQNNEMMRQQLQMPPLASDDAQMQYQQQYDQMDPNQQMPMDEAAAMQMHQDMDGGAGDDGQGMDMGGMDGEAMPEQPPATDSAGAAATNEAPADGGGNQPADEGGAQA